LGEQLLSLAQAAQAPLLFVVAHYTLGFTWFCRGAMTQAQSHLEASAALYDPQQHRSYAFLYGGQDPGVACRSYRAWALWLLGYPDQALQGMQHALALAHALSHPFSLVYALTYAARVHQLRREGPEAQAQTEAAMALATAQRFAQWLAQATILRGWALAEQGQGEAGLAQMREGLATYGTTGAQVLRPYFLALVARAYGAGGQLEEGRTALAEALMAVAKTGERFYEAELYRLQGALLLARSGEHHAEAETCFRQALAIARRQEAKSLELRAAMSLARLWQQQGKRQKAHDLLAPVYHWFTEGFDTADLQEAKALLDALSEGR
jgi:predicted ATPase